MDLQRLVAEPAHDELTAATAAIFVQGGKPHFVTHNFAHYYGETMVGLVTNGTETLHDPRHQDATLAPRSTPLGAQWHVVPLLMPLTRQARSINCIAWQ